ncbi:DUF6177 family protein [Micromonospora rosaria]|nr:DUF6177 family protein [Micromonospora rosaria]
MSWIIRPVTPIIRRVGWPVVDVVTERVFVVHQSWPVASLHHGLVDALVVAEREGRAVQLVTPATTHLTLPLWLALRGGPTPTWVVSSPDGTCRDGYSSAPLRWQDGAFEPYADTGPPPEASDERGTGGQLWILIEAVHERPTAVFGVGAEVVCRALTGQRPAGWGPAEPVSERWRTRDLTDFAIQRAPHPSVLVVVGERCAGLIEITPTEHAVAESTLLAIDDPGPTTMPPDRLRDLADTLAVQHPIGIFCAVVHRGQSGLSYPPGGIRLGRPRGLAAGPAARPDVSLTEALALPGAQPIGPPHRETVWYDLADGWDSVTAVADGLRADTPMLDAWRQGGRHGP